MTLQRRQFLHLAAGGAAAMTAPRDALAQAYPSRPVTMVVPFPAAGPADVLARILSEPMRVALGQPVVIENISGAAGSIAVGRVARAAPDGYTVILGNLGTHVVNGAIYSLHYDLVKDFEPVCMLPTNYQLLLAKSGLPAKDLKELVPWLKANAAKITIGTAGPGAPSHLTAVYFQNALGRKFQLVPYRGTPQVIADLIAGQIYLVLYQA
jgi:tripartite-type tricarboxylate transporter receptor subunit TctC